MINEMATALTHTHTREKWPQRTIRGASNDQFNQENSNLSCQHSSAHPQNKRENAIKIKAQPICGIRFIILLVYVQPKARAQTKRNKKIKLQFIISCSRQPQPQFPPSPSQCYVPLYKYFVAVPWILNANSHKQTKKPKAKKPETHTAPFLFALRMNRSVTSALNAILNAIQVHLSFVGVFFHSFCWKHFL